jgi:hypothetical protein
MPGGATCTTSGATHCVISGLARDVAYVFSLSARNPSGVSPAIVTPAVTLAVPVVTVNGGIAVVSWRTAPSTAWGTPHYRVSLAPGALRCSSVAVTHCTFAVAPDVLHYGVTLQFLSQSGAPVSTVTATVGEVIFLQAYFATGSYVLSPATQLAITNLAKSIARNGVASLTIYGHADATGPGPYNLVLSRERAQAVAAYLREQLARFHAASFDVYVVGGGVSLSNPLYSYDRNVVIVTSFRVADSSGT